MNTKDNASASPACLISLPFSFLSPGPVEASHIEWGKDKDGNQEGARSSHTSRSAALREAALNPGEPGLEPLRETCRELVGQKGSIRHSFIHSFIQPTFTEWSPSFLSCQGEGLRSPNRSTNPGLHMDLGAGRNEQGPRQELM